MATGKKRKKENRMEGGGGREGRRRRKIKRTGSVDGNVEKLESMCIADRNVKRDNYCGK
jgi:hypothetical protein